MWNMTITYNGQSYVATYNPQTGYYEVELEAPSTGGIYQADIDFSDFWEEQYEDSLPIQIWAKEQIKIDTNKVFMWIFDYYTFEVKDIVELSDYEINIDEETNAKSIISILKKTTAQKGDIIAVKRNNEVIYWGTINEIQNEDGEQLYQFAVKYLTNLFDEDIELHPKVQAVTTDMYYNIGFSSDNRMIVSIANSVSDNEANVVLYENGNSDFKKWSFETVNQDTYYIKNLGSNLYLTAESMEDQANVYQKTLGGTTAERELQQWQIVKVNNTDFIKLLNVGSQKYLTVDMGSAESGTNIKIYSLVTSKVERQEFILNQLDELIIRNDSIEEFIAKKINDNITNNDDTFINKTYLEIRVNSNTALQTSVTNVENGIFNLHTWMTNCTQNYDIVYSFSIENKKLVMEIENKTFDKELIDTQAQAISNYTEVFETDVVSKVIVLTSTQNYTLFLLNDRTTTTDKNNVNRAAGRTETVYTEDYEDAQQKALDTMKANSYNHNITFSLYNKYIKVGTPIAIKTKESIIFNSYISAIKITPKKFYEYICGNIRIKFIDKLLKERSK